MSDGIDFAGLGDLNDYAGEGTALDPHKNIQDW